MKIVILTCLVFLCFAGVHCDSTDEEMLESRELVNINGTFYYVSAPSNYFTILEAVRICNDVGMKLISIQTKEKLEIISDYLTRNGHDNSYYWTSGIRIADGVFLWSGTGEEFTYYNWDTELSQPNESPTNPYVCVHIAPATGMRKFWDADCGSTKSFICESI